MKNGLIILSGGMDSITMLYEYQDNIKMAISFDYGSNHNMREIPFAKIHCRRQALHHPPGFYAQALQKFVARGCSSYTRRKIR